MKSLTTLAYTRGPRVQPRLKSMGSWIDSAFDFAFTSKYNPLYQSGTIASYCLTLVLLTGVYLVFLYRLSFPFESMLSIQNAVFFDRWIRALHRYASDLAAVAVCFHVLRLIIEGRTWGPRFLAWISGVIMLGILLFSAWTGYAMVWDRHGQRLVEAGARMFDRLPIFADPVSTAFLGGTNPGSSFFFMNLFAHVAIPLAMILVLWVHTSRLARSRWFPDSSTSIVLTIGLVLLSIVYSAPLDEPANLLRIGGHYTVDAFYTFWLPWALSASASLFIFMASIAFFALLLLVPFFWRPNEASRPGVAFNDVLRCEGCKQCVSDCPFDAISMVPRTVGTGSEFVAEVNSKLCVSCGICAGSCDQFSIGPADRKGRVQLEWVKGLKSKNQKDSVVVIQCGSNSGGFDAISSLSRFSSQPLVHLAVECTGALHAGFVTSVLANFRGVFIISCPTYACQFREGQLTLVDRLMFGREPTLPDRIDKKRIAVVAHTRAELPQIESRFKEFLAVLPLMGVEAESSAWAKSEVQKEGKSPNLVKSPRVVAPLSLVEKLKVVAFTSLALLATARLSQIQVGEAATESLVRLNFRIHGQNVKICEQRTQAELEKIPVHMRLAEPCQFRPVSYELVVEIDGKEQLRKALEPKGAKADRPIIVAEELLVSPGQRQVKVLITPRGLGADSVKSFSHQFEHAMRPGQAVLVTLDQSKQELDHFAP